MDQLRRLIFASKSERFVPASAPEQMELFEQATFGKLSGTADAGTSAALSRTAVEVEKQKITYERKKGKKHPGRTPLPEHLPVRRVPIEPEEDASGMIKIGEEITRKVEHITGKFEIIEYVRSTYARPEAEQTEDKPASRLTTTRLRTRSVRWPRGGRIICLPAPIKEPSGRR